MQFLSGIYAFVVLVSIVVAIAWLVNTWNSCKKLKRKKFTFQVIKK